MTMFVPLVYLLGSVTYIPVDNSLLRNGDFESSSFTGNWYCRGCTITSSNDAYAGQKSGLVSNRTADWNGLAQNVSVTEGKHYKVTAMVKLLSTIENDGMYQAVQMTLVCKDSAGNNTDTRFGVTPFVQPGQWFEVGGVNSVPNGAHGCYIFIDTKAPAEHWVDNVAVTLIPDEPDWKKKADERIDQHRKADINIRLTGPGADSTTVQIDLHQTSHEFHFGSAIYAPGFNTPERSKYREIFYKNFEWAVLENALKWARMEPQQGQIDYATPLSAIKAMREHGIKVRCHCFTWGKYYFVPGWVQSMAPNDIRAAVKFHIEDALNHTKGMCEQWDVNNENLHGDWFERHTRDPNISMDMFRYARNADTSVDLYMNDYGMVNYPEMAVAYKDTALKYKAAGVPITGLGVQAHFRQVDRLAVEAQLNILAEADLPIMITEMTVNVVDENLRAKQFEEAFYTMFSHPSVKGIVLWGFWDKQLYMPNAALFEGPDLTPNAAGQVYQTFYNDLWRTRVTNAVIHGSNPYTIRAFKGDYTLRVKQGATTLTTQQFTLTDGGRDIQIKMDGNEHSNTPSIVIG